MPMTLMKPREPKPSDGERFISKLGKAPTFALKEVATALYVAHRGKQAELLVALRSADLIASVCWPDPTVAVDLPASLWNGIRIEDFSIREKAQRGWREIDYELGRRLLIRHLVVPRLRAIRDRCVNAPEATRGVVQGQPNNGLVEALQDFELAIYALEKGRASAEVFVTPRNAQLFAIKFFGSITHRGPGTPKTEALWINEALVEAFRRLYGISPRPKQDALVADMLIWWNRHFDQRGDTFIRNEILRPIWKALKLPKDPR